MTLSPNLVHFTVQIPMKSHIARDTVETNLHYLAPSAISSLTDTDIDHICGDIANFWKGSLTGGIGSSVAAYLGNEISETASDCVIKLYEVPSGGGHEGAPFAFRTFTMSGLDNNTMPEEVACVLSFRTNYDTAVEFSGSTRPRARLRNRIYVGPLGTAARTQDSVTKRVSPSTGIVTDLQVSAIEYLSVAASGHGWDWRVVSKRGLTDETVTFVSVDNAFDTQRRRGPSPTIRSESAV